MQVVLNPRELKRFKIVEVSEQIRRLDSSTFEVKSESGNGSYLVTIENEQIKCSCPDFAYRSERVGLCKHCYAVKFSLLLKDSVSQVPVINQTANYCKVCGSANIIKLGLRLTKKGKVQRYFCKDCEYRFVVNEDGFAHMKSDPKIVVQALHLYFKGLSLRKVADFLKQNYGLGLHNTTILKWIRKYADLIQGYVDKLSTELSGIWHADEMKINVNGKLEWLWNVMDEETRFQLASQISHGREISDARRVLHQALLRAKNKPEAIVTDGLHSYTDAIRKEFFTLRKPRTEHVRSPGLQARTNNNIVERLNGTVRERNKVMRGLDGINSGQKIVDGQRIYYNFVKPHMSLGGKTPAEEAGVKLGLGQNKLMDLIKLSATALESAPTNQQATNP